MRIYTLNETFFDIIDTEDKAYFLGFLYADGNHFTKRNRITISLQERDKHILEKFNEIIESNRPLSFRKKETINKRKGFENCQNQFILNINNKHLSKKLLDLGLFNNKTMILKFPTENQVPEELQKHFIRGYFDGDGCVEKQGASFMGTFDFCNTICKIVKNKFNINFHTRFKSNYPTCESSIKSKSARIFLKWLYDDSSIYLFRKYEKYLIQIEYEHSLKKLRLCCVENCSNIQRSKDYCQYHYDQVRKNNKNFNLKNQTIWL